MAARRHADSYRNALMRCERCCKGFLSAFTYENHLKVHDPAVSGPNECRWCGCRFKWPNNLRTHLIETHQLKYVCKQCQRVVKGRHEALLHAEYHAGKTWECGHCARTFKKKSTFYTHVRMNHATSEPTSSTCELCGESFKGPPGLKLHQIKKCNKNLKVQEVAAPTIVAKKGFICEVCGKNCTSLSILAVHLRAHTGDRPHACPGCPLRFAKKDNMEKHHRVVSLSVCLSHTATGRTRVPAARCGSPRRTTWRNTTEW
ncbi:zinc finger protein 585B-like [Cydia amplana]|uniref:zinc finger protein 585B-like n=1 Tax=Cydia amplana TaxID=1869771 RepID=UPI002FE5FEE5